MKRIITIAIIGGIAGIVAGYFIFGSIAGQRVSLEALLSFGSGSGFGNALRRAANDVVGISAIRRNILLTGAAGAGAAVVASILGPRRRR